MAAATIKPLRRKLKKLLVRTFLLLFGLPVGYFIVAFALTAITVNNAPPKAKRSKTIYLSTNGVHLDIILPKNNLTSALGRDLYSLPQEKYLAFGWGDKDFYLNTPTWADLKVENALKAMFWKSETLMHVTRYNNVQSYWVAVSVSEEELEQVNALVLESFSTDAGSKTRLEGAGYSRTDDFYEAQGSYSCIKTCNTWANSIFKESGLKACLWTPFDFGLLGKY